MIINTSITGEANAVDNLNRFHSVYTHTPRHWSPQSQRFAGGDALLTLLSSGWSIQEDVYYEEFWHGGSRCALIYHFTLTRGQQRAVMRVVDNPFIDRLLAELPVRVVPAAHTRSWVQAKV